MEMKKYLAEPKAGELEVFIKEIKTVGSDIGELRFSKNAKYRIKQLLERTGREIERRFSYPDVKDQLRPALMEQSEQKCKGRSYPAPFIYS